MQKVIEFIILVFCIAAACGIIVGDYPLATRNGM
jgi:hypothetical protein